MCIYAKYIAYLAHALALEHQLLSVGRRLARQWRLARPLLLRRRPLLWVGCYCRRLRHVCL